MNSLHLEIPANSINDLLAHLVMGVATKHFALCWLSFEHIFNKVKAKFPKNLPNIENKLIC